MGANFSLNVTNPVIYIERVGGRAIKRPLKTRTVHEDCAAVGFGGGLNYFCERGNRNLPERFSVTL